MQQPTVSVLLPVRNAIDTIDACMESVTSQSLTNIELIAIDDGSTDGSSECLSDWAKRDRRIKLVSQGPLGLVPALNTGLQYAAATYVARMDADDIMVKSRLQEQSSYLDQHPSIGLVACQVQLFSQSKILDGYREYIRWQNQCLSSTDIAAEIFVESPLAHPSVMFRKSVVQSVGGYLEGNFPEDYELWLRLAHAGIHMAKLPKVLLQWRERHDRISRVDKRYHRSRFDWLRAEYLARYPELMARSIVYWGAGRRTRQRSALLIQKGFAPSAWIDIDPKKIGNRIDGVRVEPAQWLQQQAQQDNKPFVLSYVTNHGARDLIARQLQQYGYCRGADYLMVG